MTSIDLGRPNSYTKSKKKNKTILKSGSVHEKFEINDEYSDENIQKK